MGAFTSRCHCSTTTADVDTQTPVAEHTNIITDQPVAATMMVKPAVPQPTEATKETVDVEEKEEKEAAKVEEEDAKAEKEQETLTMVPAPKAEVVHDAKLPNSIQPIAPEAMSITFPDQSATNAVPIDALTEQVSANLEEISGEERKACKTNDESEPKTDPSSPEDRTIEGNEVHPPYTSDSLIAGNAHCDQEDTQLLPNELIVDEVETTSLTHQNCSSEQISELAATIPSPTINHDHITSISPSHIINKHEEHPCDLPPTNPCSPSPAHLSITDSPDPSFSLSRDGATPKKDESLTQGGETIAPFEMSSKDDKICGGGGPPPPRPPRRLTLVTAQPPSPISTNSTFDTSVSTDTSYTSSASATPPTSPATSDAPSASAPSSPVVSSDSSTSPTSPVIPTDGNGNLPGIFAKASCAATPPPRPPRRRAIAPVEEMPLPSARSGREAIMARRAAATSGAMHGEALAKLRIMLRSSALEELVVTVPSPSPVVEQKNGLGIITEDEEEEAEAEVEKAAPPRPLRVIDEGSQLGMISEGDEEEEEKGEEAGEKKDDDEWSWDGSSSELETDSEDDDANSIISAASSSASILSFELDNGVEVFDVPRDFSPATPLPPLDPTAASSIERRRRDPRAPVYLRNDSILPSRLVAPPTRSALKPMGRTPLATLASTLPLASRFASPPKGVPNKERQGLRVAISEESYMQYIKPRKSKARLREEREERMRKEKEKEEREGEERD
ncbi:hypothetical protein IAT38_000194 [Cryptococcus sp. DSM 104549]